jgi:RNA polymerase sigma-70 factor, ECF subfamily
MELHYQTTPPTTDVAVIVASFLTAEIKDRDALLHDCLSKLSPSHREVLELAYYHEQPVEAVAKIVGIPSNTVKTRMYYARKHLAQLLLQVRVDRTAL